MRDEPTTVVLTASTGSPRPAVLRPGWPVVLGYGAFLLWWALGLGAFVWIAAAIPMAAWLVLQPRVKLPRGFGLWILFLGWVMLSGSQLDSSGRAVGFVFRLAQYTSLTVMFVYVYNLPRSVFGLDRAVKALMVYWFWVVIGGLLAVMVPNGAFPSLAEALLPNSVASNEYVRDLVTPQFAQVQEFLGYPLPRPAAPFPYTNSWGASFSLLLPFVGLYLLRGRARRGAKHWVTGMLLVALIPAIISVNRAMWASITVGMLLVVIMTRDQATRRVLRRVFPAVVIVSLIVAFSPLGELVDDRLNTPHSDSGRGDIISQTTDRVAQSPLLGFGGPRPYEGAGIRSPLGTQGYLWFLLFSHGVPGLVLFLLSVGVLGWRARTATSMYPWTIIVLAMFVVQLPFYDLLIAGLDIVLLTLALALREAHFGDPAEGGPRRTTAAHP